MKKIVTICVGLLSVIGCASLSLKGEKVSLTSNPERTKNCKFLGNVRAEPPYGLPTDWELKLRNQAGDLGADVVFASPPGITTTVPGEAYLCKK